MKIGIFGGTFDPIHEGHISLAKAAVSELKLDKVIFIPAGNPYFKSGKRNITLGIHRYNMIKLAIHPYPYMDVIDIELHDEGETYTADTLTKLNKEFSGDELYFIVGSDSLKQMDSWYKPKRIFDLTTIICGCREDEDLSNTTKLLKDKYSADILILSEKYWKPNLISSSSIRTKLDIEKINIDRKVQEYIDKLGLYTDVLSNEQIIERLKIELKSSRFLHSVSVAETAYDLAISHGYKYPDKAYLAGLLHDIGKPYASALEHAKKGAEIARNNYNIDDEEILMAISSHTVGRCDMSELEKIIFLADFIEPLREDFDELDEIRTLSYIDYDRAIVKTIESTIDYLNAKLIRVDEKTLEVYNYYRKLITSY